VWKKKGDFPGEKGQKKKKINPDSFKELNENTRGEAERSKEFYSQEGTSSTR